MNKKDYELTNVTTYDVSVMKDQWRIVYMPESRQMMITKKRSAARRLAGEGRFILSKSTAPKAFPDVFFNTTKNDIDRGNKTIILKLSYEQYAFCNRHMVVADFIRGLINEQIRKDNDKRRSNGNC